MDGAKVGTAVGSEVNGAAVGPGVGSEVDGCGVGPRVGSGVGSEVDGARVGPGVGSEVDGAGVGPGVGSEVVGSGVVGAGDWVGDGVGERVGMVSSSEVRQTYVFHDAKSMTPTPCAVQSIDATMSSLTGTPEAVNSVWYSQYPSTWFVVKYLHCVSVSHVSRQFPIVWLPSCIR